MRPLFSIGQLRRIPSPVTGEPVPTYFFHFGGLLGGQLLRNLYRLAPPGGSLKLGIKSVFPVTAFIML